MTTSTQSPTKQFTSICSSTRSQAKPKMRPLLEEINPCEHCCKGHSGRITPDPFKNGTYEEYKRLLNAFKRKNLLPNSEAYFSLKFVKEEHPAPQFELKTLREVVPLTSRTEYSAHKTGGIQVCHSIGSKKQGNISDRCKTWTKAKDQRIQKQQNAKKWREMEQCTFRPFRLTENSPLAKSYEAAVENRNAAIYRHNAALREQHEIM